MKKFFTIILSIALFGSAYSQEYIPFPEQNATWSLYNSSWEPTFDYSSVLEITGDTVINEITYTKVMEYMPDWQNYPYQDTISRLFALYRQNIEEKKVYIIRLYLNESNEKLLYNFDENAEQPMNLPGLAYFEYSNDTIYNLEQITEVTLYDGSIRKEFKYKSVNNDWIRYFVLEGIGNKENPFGCSPIYLYPLDCGAVMPVLTCHTKNEEIIYVENDPMVCGAISTGLENPLSKTTELLIYPNPATNIINFELPNKTETANIKIYDVYGKIIKEIFTNDNKTQWNCQGVTDGVYFYQAKINGEIYRGKLVVQK